jgi:hypothetical protein
VRQVNRQEPTPTEAASSAEESREFLEPNLEPWLLGIFLDGCWSEVSRLA